MTSHAITELVLQTETILRLAVARDGQPIKSTDVVEATGLDRGSARRELRRLAEAGLLSIDGEGPDRSVHYIQTADAVDAVAALDRANGFGGHLAIGRPRWPLEKIQFNPDNVRKSIDDESIAGLADTIVEAEDVLQEIILYPPDASGVRMLHAGERRTRACQLLVKEGRLPPALVAGLPFTERAGNKAEALFIGLVENTQREDIPAWEDAKGLAAYAEETGLSARAIAFKIGRAREGSEEGVRDVQEKIRTVRKSKPADIAEVDAGRQSFDWLKRRIRKPAVEIAEQLRPIDLMTIAEVAHRGSLAPKNRHYGRETECSFKAESDPILKGLVSQGLMRFTLQDYTTHRAYVECGYAANELLSSTEIAEIYHRGPDALDALHALRVSAVGEVEAQKARDGEVYVTAWLNGPFDLSEKAQAKVEADKASKAQTRENNAAIKKLREGRQADNKAIEVKLRQTAFIGCFGSDARNNVEELARQLAVFGLAAPFSVGDYGIRDANDKTVLDVGQTFYDDRPLVRELVVMALNAAFGFPTARKDFERWIANRLMICGLTPELAAKRAPRALEHLLSELDVAFGQGRRLWNDVEASEAADVWFDKWGPTLPETGYLAWLGLFLECLGWSADDAPEAAEKALAGELKANGIAFGDPEYAWDPGDAERLARDYFAGLPTWKQPELPQDTTPVVIQLNARTLSIPPAHWSDPDPWIAAHVKDGELIDPLEVAPVPPPIDRDAESWVEFTDWIAQDLIARHGVPPMRAPAYAEKVRIRLQEEADDLDFTRAGAREAADFWAEDHLEDGQLVEPEDQSQTEGEEADENVA